MAWLQNNWVWLVVGAGFVAMHFFGHRGHRHGSTNREPETGNTTIAKNMNEPTQDGAQVHEGHGAVASTSPSRKHRHGC